MTPTCEVGDKGLAERNHVGFYVGVNAHFLAIFLEKKRLNFRTVGCRALVGIEITLVVL